MKVGDVIKIKGNLGFLTNPEMRVLEVKSGMVLLESVALKRGGLLSELNQSWYGIDNLKVISK